MADAVVAKVHRAVNVDTVKRMLLSCYKVFILYEGNCEFRFGTVSDRTVYGTLHLFAANVDTRDDTLEIYDSDYLTKP